jgi:hypothetical protein
MNSPITCIQNKEICATLVFVFSMQRSKYYTSLGFKTVDIKPTIEYALQDQILIQERLDKLCLWVRIPHTYRCMVWKVSLGVLPYEKEAWSFFGKVRRDQFDLLRNAIAALHHNPEMIHQELSPEQMIDMMMIELEIGPPMMVQRYLKEPRPAHLMSLAKAFLDIGDDLEEEDSFWLFCLFVKKFSIPFKPGPVELSEFETLMEQHNPEVLSLMRKLNIQTTFLLPWFHCYFSSVFSTQILEGVWDIIVGGAKEILPYIAVALLINCSRKLQQCSTSAEFYNIVNNMERHIDSYSAGQLAIDLWEKPVLAQMTVQERTLLGYK